MINNGYVRESIGDIIKDWDCIGIRQFSPDEYVGATAQLCDELSLTDTEKNIARKIKRIFKAEFEDSFESSEDEIKDTATKIFDLLVEFK